MKNILVTGASGYIGTHTIVELCAAGYGIIGIDNLCNSSAKAIERVQEIVNYRFPFYELNIRDKDGIERILSAHKIDAVIHFAALKAVGESVLKPLSYYENNVAGTITLLQALKKYGIKLIVFSSSATVYGNPDQVPITEDAPLRALHPYGSTKIIIEQILNDAAKVDKELRVANLRYFNPVGAHESGLIGEDPKGGRIPNNLMPYIARVAMGDYEKLTIFGNDWPTADGTPVRDYIHVMDLANGHVLALDKLFENNSCFTVNLGTGQGYSVLEIINTFARVNHCKVPYEFVARRDGDIAVCYAETSLAQKLLGWKAHRSIETMCRDMWTWQVKNPHGY